MSCPHFTTTVSKNFITQLQAAKNEFFFFAICGSQLKKTSVLAVTQVKTGKNTFHFFGLLMITDEVIDKTKSMMCSEPKNQLFLKFSYKRTN